MNAIEFRFQEASLGRIFPYYLLIDSNLKILAFGKGAAKIYPDLKENMPFYDIFTIKYSETGVQTFLELSDFHGRDVIIKSQHNETTLTGQFEFMEGKVLFTGTLDVDTFNEPKESSKDISESNYLKQQQELEDSISMLTLENSKLKKAYQDIHEVALFPIQNPDPLIRIDFKGNILQRNPAAEKLISFTHQNKVYEANSFFKLIATKIDINEERYVFETTSGDRDYSFVCSCVKDDQHINIYGRDSTDQKKHRAELERLSLVAKANQNGIVFTDPLGKIFWSNDAFCEMTGYSKEFILGKTPIEIGACEQTNREDFSKMLDPFYKGEPFQVDLIHGRKDGSHFWSRNIGQPIFDEQGKVKAYFAMLEDISLKKRYDESLEIEKSKYQNIIANMNLGLLEVDLNDVITLSNNSFSNISGFTSEELMGKKASEFLLSSESQKILKTKNEIRHQGITDSYEVKIINKKGENRNWLISGAPNYDLNGNLIGSIGIHLDITDQKVQEEQLYMLSLIAEKNTNAVIICDKVGKIEWVNTSFLEMSGFPMEEVLGRKPGQLLQGPETSSDTIEYMKTQIRTGLPFNCEIINYSKTGQKYWVRIQGQALYNKDNEIIKFFAIEEDITKKKEMEQQREFLLDSLEKSNKELEDYASIVSHDLKSPLRSIHSLIAFIKEDNVNELNSQTLEYLGMMENKVEKMDHLIEGILTYTKIDKTEITLENVNTQEIVQNIINMIHIPSHISVQIKCDLPIIKADRYRIQQLFQNIISNAVNYIDKPTGLVEVDCKSLPTHYLFSIQDNGPGIADENKEKIFKIFQSLQSSDHSTGLGLSIVKKIIDLYQGQIWIESKVGQGATFFVKLNK